MPRKFARPERGRVDPFFPFKFHAFDQNRRRRFQVYLEPLARFLVDVDGMETFVADYLLEHRTAERLVLFDYRQLPEIIKRRFGFWEDYDVQSVTLRSLRFQTIAAMK